MKKIQMSTNAPTFPYPPKPEQGTVSRLDPSEFAFETKGNVTRGMLHRPSNLMISRHGKPLDTSPYQEAIDMLPEDDDQWEWVDLGLWGSPRTPGFNEGVMMVIDLPAMPMNQYRHRNMEIRHNLPCDIELPFSKAFRPAVVYCHETLQCMKERIEHVNKSAGLVVWEGFVGKRLTSTYPWNTQHPGGKVTTDWFKE